MWRTWGSEVVQLGGEVRFFVGEGVSGGEWCGLPVTALAGVRDTDYPPQRKSFLMLAWLAEHLGHRANWFLRADDDVFVKVSRLLEFLAPLDPSRALYLGQAGRGRGQEEGRLSLAWDRNFCMGGPGVVLSRAALGLLGPLLPSCLTSLVTGHEDVELGRCVARATGASCTWAYDMQTYFYHSSSPEEERGKELVPERLEERVLDQAITLHPLKNPANMEAMALRLAARRRTRLRSDKLRAEKLEAALMLGGPVDLAESAVAELGQLSGPWDLILGHQLYSLGAGGARRKVPAHMAEGVTRAVTKVLAVINSEASAKGRVIEFRDLFYAYVHSDPQHGMTYILDLLLLYKRYRGNKMTVKVRRHVYLRQPFLPVVARLEDSLDSSPPPFPALVSGDGLASLHGDGREAITIIVPLAGQAKLGVLAGFLANYEREVLGVLEPARLVVVVFSQGEEDMVESRVREGVGVLEMRYPGYAFTVKVLGGEFSRAVGLMAGVEECGAEDLLLLLDIDIQFTAAALHTARTFTRPRQAVYFPIVFSQFRDGGGYWRDFGYGIVSVYAGDLASVKGLNMHISGWGKEDVDLYDRFLASNLSVVRAADPSLVHLYHPVVCSPSLAPDQAAMCATSRANTFLSLHTLVDTVLNSSLLVV